MEHRCNHCKKVFNNGEQIYQDEYYYDCYCSWDHLVKGMSKFFGVEKGKTFKFEGN